MHVYENVALHYFERVIQSVRVLFGNLSYLLGDDSRLLAVYHSHQLVDPAKEDPTRCILRVSFEFSLYFFTLGLRDYMQ
jgi:hypothetical protein